jgi:hypothetical protein
VDESVAVDPDDSLSNQNPIGLSAKITDEYDARVFTPASPAIELAIIIE